MTAERGSGEGSSSAAKKPKRQDSSDEAARDVRQLLVGFVQLGNGKVGSLPATKGDMNARPARLLPHHPISPLTPCSRRCVAELVGRPPLCL